MQQDSLVAERRQGTKELSLSNRKDRASIYTDEEKTSMKGASLGEDEARAGHAKLERPPGHPSGDDKYM